MQLNSRVCLCLSVIATLHLHVMKAITFLRIVNLSEEEVTRLEAMGDVDDGDDSTDGPSAVHPARDVEVCLRAKPCTAT